jgi:hypothetical protein
MGKPWTNQDDADLLDGIKRNKTIEYIANLKGQGIDFVRSRLKGIAANYYMTQGMAFEQIELLTGIKKEEIVVRPSLSRPASYSGSSKDSISTLDSDQNPADTFVIDAISREEPVSEPILAQETVQVINLEKSNPCTELTIRLIDLTIYLAFTLRRNILKRAQGTLLDESPV